MINYTALPETAIARRASLIYNTARSESDLRLWRAVLGSNDSAPAPLSASTVAPTMGLDALLTVLKAGDEPAAPPAVTPTPPPPRVIPSGSLPGLGANAHYSAKILAAAQRTGVPAPALAAIINAESAKARDGSWRTDSRNPRSSATGIGQFLAGTWRSEAERAGTWLNRTARANGWIGSDGTVLPAARSALLALRHDGEASINATADYARRSLDRLARAGVAIGDSVSSIASAAYIGHNLGLGDAVKFLHGGLGEAHAKRLLDAQIGIARADAKIAGAGSAVAAHRQWLSDFVARHVQVIEMRA